MKTPDHHDRQRSQSSRTPLANDDFQIVDFSPEYAHDFQRLNVQWITLHWELEDQDRLVLEHPQQYIIDKGGAVFIAIYKGEAVGTVALIAQDHAAMELAKMAVSPTVQGKGFGLALGEFALERAQHMGATHVYLESNAKLGPALALYRKLGFSEIEFPEEGSPYARCDVRMEKRLNMPEG